MTTTEVTAEELVDEIGNIDAEIAGLYRAKDALMAQLRADLKDSGRSKIVGTDYEAAVTPGKLTTREEYMVALLEVEGLGENVLIGIGAYERQTVSITGLDPKIYNSLRTYFKAIPHGVENVAAKWPRLNDLKVVALGGDKAAAILENASYRAVGTLKVTKKGE